MDSPNLGDFLRIKEEDHRCNLSHRAPARSVGGRSNASGVTLDVLLSDKSWPSRPADVPLHCVQSNRTLLDILREDQTSGFGGASAQRDNRSSWQHFKERIRLRRIASGSPWTSTVPASEISTNNSSSRMVTVNGQASTHSNLNSDESAQPNISQVGTIERLSGRFDQNNSVSRRALHRQDNADSRRDEAERSGDTREVGEAAEAEQPVRTSLMTLLAETDRHVGFDCSTYMMEEAEEEGEDAATTAAVEVGVYNSCCVCMVRHKGAAFIPCGHTFCRLCSRELWVQRGNCPLCNNYIREILDIF